MALRLDQLRNADLNLLVYLTVLVEEKSVTKAAKRLRLTQSALSRVLVRVRELFADDLLVRVDNEYQTTARGEEILQQLSSLLPQIDTLICGRPFDPATDAATFRVAATHTMTHIYGPGFALRHAKTPNVKIDFAACTDACYQDLENDRRDLFVGTQLSALPPSLEMEELFRERNVCAVDKNSRFQHLISLADYTAAKHISISAAGPSQVGVDEALLRLNIQRDCALSVPYVSAALHMVANSDLIVTLPSCLRGSLANRKTLRFIRPPREIEVCRNMMIWHRRQHADSRSLWLRQTVREVTAELLSSMDTKTMC